MTIMSEKPASASVTNTPGAVTTSAPSSSQSSSPGATSVVFVTSVLNQDGGKAATTTAAPQNTGPADNNSSNNNAPHIGTIVGGAVAGAAALIAIAIIAFFLLRRRKRQGEGRHQFQRFSLHDDLDPMYRDRRSVKSLFQSDKASELEGSVPDLPGELEDKALERRYDSPGDVGRLAVTQVSRGYRGDRGTSQVSPLSQNFSTDEIEPAELPSYKSPPPVFEMPERSSTKRGPR